MRKLYDDSVLEYRLILSLWSYGHFQIITTLSVPISVNINTKRKHWGEERKWDRKEESRREKKQNKLFKLFSTINFICINWNHRLRLKRLSKDALFAVAVKTNLVSSIGSIVAAVFYMINVVQSGPLNLFSIHIRADLHFAMTIHKILCLLIIKMEKLLTANSGLLDNKCVFTTVISSNLSIVNGDPLIICLVVQLSASGETFEAGMLRINPVVYYFFSFSCPHFQYLFFSHFFTPFSLETFTFIVHL